MMTYIYAEKFGNKHHDGVHDNFSYLLHTNATSTAFFPIFS